MKKDLGRRVPEPGGSVLETEKQPTNIPRYKTFPVEKNPMPSPKSDEKNFSQKK